MNGKTLLIVGVVAVVVTGAAVVATKKESSQHAPAKSAVKAKTPGAKDLVFPSLKDKLNDIAKVQIEDHSTSATLVKVGDAWGLEQKFGYPAKFGQAREMVLKLADMEKLEKKTNNKASFSRIDVEDVTAQDSKAKQVTLWDDKGTKLGSIILGKINYGNSADSTSQFVRIPGEDQTWLVNGQVFADSGAQSWLETDLVAVPSTRVKGMVIEHPDAPEAKVDASRSDSDQTDLVLHTVPEGREADDASKLQSLTNSLQGVRFDDVVKLDTLKLDGIKPITATVTAFDGLVVKIDTYKVNDKNYTTFVASVSDKQIEDENLIRTEKAKSAHAAQLAAQEAALKDAAEKAKDTPDATPAPTPTPVPETKPELVDGKKIQEEAEKINKKHGGWAYVLPSYVLDRFTRKNDYFLKEVKAEDMAGPQKPETQTSGGSAPVSDATVDLPGQFTMPGS